VILNYYMFFAHSGWSRCVCCVSLLKGLRESGRISVAVIRQISFRSWSIQLEAETKFIESLK
jgi:hypothetical protein